MPGITPIGDPMTSTIFDNTVVTDGTLALAHEDIVRVKRAGVFENITGDVNALVNTPTPVTVQREAYGLKGTDSTNVLAYTQVITFTVEGVRDSLGRIAQAWLVELLKVARSTGADNKLDAQTFDGRDENMIALEGSYSVAAVKSTTGFKDKLVWSFTLTSDGPVGIITSPISGSGIPIVESALPTQAAATESVFVRGYNVANITAATIGAVTITSIEQIPGEPNIVVLEMPAGTAGSAPIVLTNAIGDSTSFGYIRA